MKKILHPARSRGHANYGWLEANYSFSFANYFDPSRLQFGQLRVLNDDKIAPGMGFGKHPHQNMEIVTIPLSGALQHEDSLGHSGVVRAGEIQVMSAGHGVEHSEFNASKEDALTLFQIWIFSDTQNAAPRYDQKNILPLLKPNTMTPVVVPQDAAKDGALWIHQNAYFYLGEFEQTTNITLYLHGPNQGLYFMVIEGAISVDDTNLGPRDAMGIHSTETVDFQASPQTKLLAIEIPM
ncbi:MAG: pirin family protein [Flavobacteriaceae bacterium]|nr:pirin family protein [Flavobacteriaceae bacterium]